MLALTRKKGQTLVIDDQVIVTVVEIKGDNVKLAIEAPQRVKIYRGEIYDEIVRENRIAVANVGEIDLLKGIKKS